MNTTFARLIPRGIRLSQHVKERSQFQIAAAKVEFDWLHEECTTILFPENLYKKTKNADNQRVTKTKKQAFPLTEKPAYGSKCVFD
jgi:hypothetical protein